MTGGLGALAAHLGYTTPQHRPDCTATTWDVDYRLHHTVRSGRNSGHSCPLDADNPGACGHGDSHQALAVRIYCRRCGAATELNAELPAAPMQFDTARLGMGTKPRRCGDLWIYQGPPPQQGILSDQPGEPQWYLVARRNAPRLDPQDVVGAVEPALTPRGKPCFAASWGLTELFPDHDGRPTPCFQHVGGNDGTFFPTVTAAARWLGEKVPAVASTPA
ncbi:hypothetical protein [Streptomyces silvensis]|uniref:Uncharacterized protein n=1 Tax=Streptomyces silvensis TaxID=1765722 RepID=A0A0W7X3N9_9ACTN|nr:hypothetical protein [Streptomyces silvensis]KUF17411.1 hypothetical protein AT728_16570 [Streptomyces silvensis]